MLSKSDARALLEFKYEGVRVEAGIDYENLWVFRAYLPIGGGEEHMNPFLSVDKETGDTSDFSVRACPDPVELMRLFAIEDDVPSVPEKPATPKDALEMLRKKRR